MSNFETMGQVTGGITGTAPQEFVASTVDSLADMMAAGYLNDISKLIKANDIFRVNYLDQSAFPLNTGMSAVYQEFRVQYDPVLENWNLIPVGEPQSAISALGVYSANYSNAGGSATVVVSDANINANSVVLARWKSSANAVNIQKVTPANGSLTVLSSGDPGASVLEYISVLPSVALQDAGVIAAKYSNAGGSATLVISNDDVVAADVVMANIVSSANAVSINKVTSAAGSITILFSGNPGVSVISYFVVSPSSELAAAGLYSAKANNAGGSATTTVTDANIGVDSIVVADWNSSANAVIIQKVTPAAGSFDVLSSGDPGLSVLNFAATAGEEGGQSGEFLEAANNLSDVDSVATSRNNLGLGTAQSPVFAGVTLDNEGLHLLDTNASHDLIVKPGSNLTADRIFTLTTGDAARLLDISAADVTVSVYGATLVDDATALAALTTLGLKRAASAVWGGGGVSNAFVATGVLTTDLVFATLVASANAASIEKVVPTANTLTVTFSADPGAGTQIHWLAIPTV